jgi:hypothetical protein
VTTLRVLLAAILAAALACLSPVAASAVSSDTTTSSTDAAPEQSQDTGSTPSEGSQPSEPADEPSEETSEEASQPAEEPSEEESKPAEEPSEEESKPAEEPSEEAAPDRTGVVNGEDELDADEAEARTAAEADPAAEPIAVDDTAVVRAGRTVRIRVTDNDTDAGGATVTLPEEPADGTAAVVGDAVDFTPADGVEGTTRFEYALAVGGAVRSRATVTVTVVPPTTGTRAIDDKASTPVNTNVPILVLGNDVDTDPAELVLVDGPGHGTAEVTFCDGEFCGPPWITYSPDEGFSGTDTFRYGLRVDGETVDTATVTVDVSGDGESGARAVDDTVTVQAGGGVTFFPTANDDPSTWIPEVQQGPSHGQVTPGEGRSFRYTPDSDFVSGVDTFTYRLTPPPVIVDIRLDDRPLDNITLLSVAPVAAVAAVDVATVTVIVNGPVSVEDTATTTAGTSVDIDVAGNDTGTSGFCLVVPPGQAMAGTALVGEDETVRYTPAPGFVGTDAFSYAYQPGCRGDATVAPATVTVTVTAPEAADDRGRTFTGPVGGLPVNLDVLENDDPVAGLFRLAVGTPRLGTAQVVPRGEVTPVIRYTPAPGTTGGTDTFEYQLVSSTGDVVARASVSVVVTPVTADADTEFTTAGTAVEIDAGANDTLPPGVTAVVSRPPGEGSAEVVDAGGAVFRYTPGDGFDGADTFEYALVAAGADEAPFRLATQTVTITRAQAVADAATSRFRLPVEVDVRANDVGAADLQVRVATPPEDGSVDVDELRDGVFRVTPIDGFAGTAEFTYELVDDGRAVDAAEVAVEVPEPTIARDDEADTDAGVPVPVDVLANDETTTGLRVEVPAQPARGAVAVADDGTVTYTPEPGLTGTDTFTYALVADGLGDPVATADVRVTVRAPVAVDDAVTMFGGRSADIDVLGNDRFAAGFTVRPLAPSDGTSALLTAGGVRYTPDAGFAGTDTFRYELVDAENAVVARATVRVTVRLVDARDDAVTTERGKRARIRVLANDDVVGGITVRLVQQPAHGTLTLRADGRVDYVPTGAFTGTDRFRYALTGVVRGVRTDLDVAGVTVTVEAPPPPDDGNPGGGDPGGTTPGGTTPGGTPGDGTPTDTTPDPAEQPVTPTPGTNTAPEPERGVELSVDTTSPGAEVQVTGHNCPPTGEVVVEVDGRQVQTGTAAADGTYQATVPAPTGVGRHDVGVTCGSGTTTTRLDVVVTTMQSGTQAPAGAAAAAAALLLFFLLSGLGMNPTGRTRTRPA